MKSRTLAAPSRHMFQSDEEFARAKRWWLNLDWLPHAGEAAVAAEARHGVTAILAEVFDPSQPRWEEGTPQGGQWKPTNQAALPGVDWAQYETFRRTPETRPDWATFTEPDEATEAALSAPVEEFHRDHRTGGALDLYTGSLSGAMREAFRDGDVDWSDMPEEAYAEAALEAWMSGAGELDQAKAIDIFLENEVGVPDAMWDDAGVQWLYQNTAAGQEKAVLDDIGVRWDMDIPPADRDWLEANTEFGNGRDLTTDQLNQAIRLVDNHQYNDDGAGPDAVEEGYEYELADMGQWASVSDFDVDKMRQKVWDEADIPVAIGDDPRSYSDALPTPHIEDSAESLDDWLREAPAVPKDTVVYRGGLHLESDALAERLLAGIEAGEIREMGFNTFASTSLSPFVAAQFTGSGSVMLAIKGGEGVYIDRISTHEGEREVLYRAGHVFKVLGVERGVDLGRNPRGGGDSPPLNVIYLEWTGWDEEADEG